ncbi:hypothetical protein AKJ65_04145 [candidate division MSBL1 archaeon SCGC-AAA259E19]|uniref:CARDB domain-containing protein n=1 Tax=candidate division MSBL1 archaeon SCGC-AAA259E19 TaxID=1698264 RepID=A0A133UJX0_9EURY|nr:hypothetical protein AKJ65_04145 [candidate division MSBL1 archaeon SCGC-AAA259E19]
MFEDWSTKKKIGFGVLVFFVIILIAAALAPSEEEETKPAKFEVSNLSMSSSEIKLGGSVNVSVNVKNTGGKEGSKEVKLTFDGTTKTESVTLASGEETTVSFEISREETGTYDVSISGMSDSFKVIEETEPAEFQISNLSLSSSEVEPGQTLTVSVDVKNTGGKSGTKTVKFNIGEETKTRDVTLGAGESDEVSISVTKQEEGTFDVNVSGLSESFSVKAPAKAEFEVTNLQINPSEVEPEQTVAISADVKNTGNATGSYELKLKIDGTTERTKKVELGAKKSTSITFEVSENIEDSYSVSLEGLSGSFKVIQPVPEPVNIQGRGDTSTETFKLVEGLSIFHFKCEGNMNFIVELMNAETGETPIMPLVNVIGSFEGSTIVGVTGKSMQVSPGEFLLNIQADGNWEATVEQPRPDSAPSTPQTFSGKGHSVVGPFELEKGTATFEMRHDGSQNFIVELYDKDGNSPIMPIANELGSYEGSKTIGITGELMKASPGIHYLDITADGNWEIKVTQ